jgi:trigger factor
MEGAETAGRRFLLKVTGVKNRKPAEFEQAFFDEVFGPGKATDRASFEALVKENLENAWAREAVQWLEHEIEDALLAETAIPLPDDFLKRWLAREDGKQTASIDVEEQYGRWSRGLRMRMILQRIARENDLRPTDEEISRHAVIDVLEAMTAYGPRPDLTNELLKDTTARYLAKEENRWTVEQAVIRRKALELLKGQIRTAGRTLGIDEFRRMVHEHRHTH